MADDTNEGKQIASGIVQYDPTGDLQALEKVASNATADAKQTKRTWAVRVRGSESTAFNQLAGVPAIYPKRHALTRLAKYGHKRRRSLERALKHRQALRAALLEGGTILPVRDLRIADKRIAGTTIVVAGSTKRIPESKPFALDGISEPATPERGPRKAERIQQIEWHPEIGVRVGHSRGRG